MTDPLTVTLVTALLIVLSAFFVVIEFALLGARRYRLEAEAANNRSARAALRGINELTIMLAGAQLGITACTFALGAITKPAVDAWLGPVLGSWGVPAGIAGGTAFALSLLFVTFLHLVVGEMAPKSWAIAHPERSAKLIGLPSRGFIWLVRPLLVWVNAIANRLVAASGVTPVNRAAVGGLDAGSIRHLVEHSAASGALDASFETQLSGVLELETLTVRSLIAPDGKPTVVPDTASVADVQEVAARSKHLRILVQGPAGEAPGVIHVRDTLLEPAQRKVRELAGPAFLLDADVPVYEALAQIRSASVQLAAVMDNGKFIGVITLSDVLRRVLPMSMTPAA
ncbi:hemolysin family protein [Arthrobacter sp. 260]|uniref:CNNM domain-containing protein n=1 Tax=Arthrobacter sp. 260 TaxID=2735314 RepID=UPI0014928CB0|nr:hemolysin family protein [Arthrobacter sp. 260]NOJ61347.1 HlyC/CorC family transporter [Arthrobacter sp. 260]